VKTIIALLLLTIAVPASARHQHTLAGCEVFCTLITPQNALRRPNRREATYNRRLYRRQVRLEPAGSVWGAWSSHTSNRVVSHPTGCPRVAFCGCGASGRRFGRSIRELWRAANWFKFPRAAPAPGMAAVRRHHVMILETQGEHGGWIVYDANSGGHATRIHERSLSGYTIVNPS
jgi:hypothetical protein